VVYAEESSFRDPAGQVILKGNKYLRQVNPCYFDDYQHIMSSGLYDELADKALLLKHKEISRTSKAIVLEPEQLWFTSYPYEWCFSYLKQAALVTLEANRIALKYNMVLKDASAYNIQWHNGRMVLIDTISFASYQEGQPWMAYRQFIEHFLSPLLLIAYGKGYLHRLPEILMEGIPADVTASLLPARLRLKPSLVMHLYSQSMAKHIKSNRKVSMPRRNLEVLLDSLEHLVSGLIYKPRSDWTEYQDADSYTKAARKAKKGIVSGILADLPKGSLCDLGANTGEYSRLARDMGYKVLATDKDYDCVESIARRHPDILTLVVDLCNPSPAIGWANRERRGFLERLKVDTISALALIHHICIGSNVPVGKVAELLANHCRNLIIEFIPPEDPKAVLLAGDKQFPSYSQQLFEKEFSRHFRIKQRVDIKDSCRSIYRMLGK
jgi:hypothetical protein